MNFKTYLTENRRSQQGFELPMFDLKLHYSSAASKVFDKKDKEIKLQKAEIKLRGALDRRNFFTSRDKSSMCFSTCSAPPLSVTKFMALTMAAKPGALLQPLTCSASAMGKLQLESSLQSMYLLILCESVG